MKKLLWIAVLLVPAIGSARAQTDTLAVSIDNAVERALEQSEEIQLARRQSRLADIGVTTARSGLLPQISSSMGYVRTLASVFDVGMPAMPDSLRFNPDPNASVADRLSYLEQRVPSAGMGSLGSLFGDLPFGRENAYAFSLSGSQVLFSGGRIRSGIEIAHRLQEVSELGYRETAADLERDVRTAYYQSLLAREMVDIAGAALEQAERFLAQERLRFDTGRASDLEVMRAEVALENLRPQLVQAQNAREVSELNLRRLVNIPVQVPLRLTGTLEIRPQDALSAPDRTDQRYLERPALAAAEEQIRIRREGVRLARGSFLPSVALSTSYARQLFPSSTFALNEDWRTDWTVTLGISFPLFEGLKRSASFQQAQVELEQARLERDRLREGLGLQYEQARGERERALSVIEARRRTIDQAQRVYDLTLMRYEKGLATQLDVTDARLALLQARTFLAQAQADYQIAQVNLKRVLGLF